MRCNYPKWKHKISSQLTKARDSPQKAGVKGGDVILGKISVGKKTNIYITISSLKLKTGKNVFNNNEIHITLRCWTVALPELPRTPQHFA